MGCDGAGETLREDASAAPIMALDRDSPVMCLVICLTESRWYGLWYTEPGEVPAADSGRRGGDDLSSGRPGELNWLFLREGTGVGAVDRGRLAGAAVSGLRVFDRRGGGTVGFDFSSSTCCSCADLNEEGEDGAFSLSTEVENRRWKGVGAGNSADCGRTLRCSLCGGDFGGGVPVLSAASFAGFCFIGGDFIGSFRGVVKYAPSWAPSMNCEEGSSIRCLGLCWTVGGGCVFLVSGGASSLGSGGSLKTRCGLGDRTRGGDRRAMLGGAAADLDRVADGFSCKTCAMEVVVGTGV
jgi:hypothetical protein